ncbi:GntR family transcriptional regulator [Clavibacter michiganensis]|uniref:GntR family transcriptional regulator n=1 Tax=Clavibacter michiganensis TaxID=28447 RepID=A0A2S5VY67_9MICO|nr:GntR family transcriptional regulator [Clavibacter michiganensis]
MITLSGSAPPAEQIRDQIVGLIAAGQLAADQRLSSVRQLAKDLDVAPGTVGKAYKALETEGYLTTRTGGGTRVSHRADTTPRPVLEAARHLADASTHAEIGLDDAVRILRAIWPEQHREASEPKDAAPHP